MILYSIKNTINGKEYIGATTQTLARRLAEHLSRCKRGLTHPLYEDIRNLGINKFEVKQLKKFNTLKELYTAEKETIFEKDNLYNRTLGGQGIPGFRFSEESKKKLSDIRTGKPLSEITKQKLSKIHKGKSYHNATKGIPLTEEHKLKISLNHGKGMLNKKHSETSIKSMSDKRQKLIKEEKYGKLFTRLHPEIKLLKNSGMSFSQIAKKYDCTASAIFYFCKRMDKQ